MTRSLPNLEERRVAQASSLWPGHRLQAIAAKRFRRGFSFTEILFAVLILGIGFIMVAAMFPVAIQQTKSTAEETNAATIARGGVNYLEKYASSTMNDQSGTVQASGLFWSTVQGNLVLPHDPRYAWIPMYRRTNGSNYAQVIVIAVQDRNRPAYDASDVTATGTPPTPTLMARPLGATFNHVQGGTDTVTLSEIGAGGSNYLPAAVSGAYIVVQSDTTTPQPVNANYPANGWIYRLGNPTGTANVWELAPGNDMQGAPYAPSTATVLIVGRGYDDPTNANPSYTGPAQDIAAYTTFVKVN